MMRKITEIHISVWLYHHRITINYQARPFLPFMALGVGVFVSIAIVQYVIKL